MKDTAWSKALGLLRERVDSGHFKVWIESLHAREAEDAFVVHAVSPFAAGFVRDRFMPLISQALTEACGRDVAVRITEDPVPQIPASGPDRNSPTTIGSAGTAVPAARTVSAGKAQPSVVVGRAPAIRPAPVVQQDLPLRYDEAAWSISARSWRHSFDDFVVGPNNELAFAASRSICKESQGSDILFLSSAPGLGKTHLIQAAGQHLCKECNYRMPRVEYLTAEEFASRLVMAFRHNDTDSFKSRYRDVDVLLLEDVHFLQGKEKMQEELLATLKTLQDRGSKVIFSSSFVPKDMRGMSDQLLSRLHSGFVAVIDRPDRLTRKRIFQEKARLWQVDLPEEVSDFLAESIDSDVRIIESCLKNLALKARLLKCGITLRMAWEAVRHYGACEKKLDLDGIVQYVSEGYGIPREQMRSKSRKRDLVVARNTVFYLARKHTDLSLQEIGNVFDRSHSTVIKGITSLEREMSRESSLGRQMASAIAIIERNGGIISPSS